MDIRENFCGACVTVPLAFMGAGAAFSAEKKAKIQKWAIILTILSIIFTIYYIYFKKCSSCKLR
jgi:lipoprotein signal peptidase